MESELYKAITDESFARSQGKGRVLARPGWEGEMAPARRHPLIAEALLWR